MTAVSIMFQGTGSSVGKSTLVAGICRLLADRGLRPLPFKPQNMSNNAAVTRQGGEIGRAQWLQARACRAEPCTDMNPVLLKPQSGGRAQLVVGGRVRGAVTGAEFQAAKPGLLADVLAAHARLASRAGVVVVEGAGSAAETNLRTGDIANMGFARAAGVPVVVIGDIDRGGVIASLVGTRVVLDPADAALVRGFVVNRMRGDANLFETGLREIERRTGWPSLGLVPHTGHAERLPAEDGAGLADRPVRRSDGARVEIAVPRLPHIANFDDLDPLDADPRAAVRVFALDEPLPASCDLVILPGSKSVIDDLAALGASGWRHDIIAHARRGGRVLGLCGGYQMLGRAVADPDHHEGPLDRGDGLGLLDVATVLGADKRLREVSGRTADGAPCAGYEMHLGRTTGPDAERRPFAHLAGGEAEGARSRDGRIEGTYLHGLLAHPAQRDRLLGPAPAATARRHHDALVDEALDGLAGHLARHLDIDRLLAIATDGVPG